MKHKILLAGKNGTIVDDFFYALNDEFECMTTSNRSGDIANHIHYFQPEVFVYCFASETKEDIIKLITALEEVGRRSLQMILIGDSKSCNEFLHLKPELVKLVLHRPITATTIREKLEKYFERQSGMEAEEPDELRDLYNYVKNMQMDVEAMPTISFEEEEQKQILVIDDDPMMLRLIKAELKDRYNVATAVNGKVGIKFLERKSADLILLDYEMPEEDGPAVLRKLRENENTKNIPVVFLTGINEKEKIQKVLAMKPQGYLLKPIECEQLVSVINQVLG